MCNPVGGEISRVGAEVATDSWAFATALISLPARCLQHEGLQQRGAEELDAAGAERGGQGVAPLLPG